MASRKRFSREHPCPICAGWDAKDRGQGQRCSGYSSDDGTYVRCSREEQAGGLNADEYGLYRHLSHGECRCGVEHAPARTSGTTPEAIYDYRDAKGAILVQVTRWAGKRFSQRRPDGAGGWIQDAKDVPWTLYRLPELLASSETVYVVEGEKDVETLRKLGLTATTKRGGATAAKKTDWSPLKGRDVVVIADRDEDGKGQRFAVEVGKIVGARAVLECTRGKDVTDHIAAGGRIAELVPVRLLEVKPDVKPADPKPAPKPIQIADWKRFLLTKKNGIDLRPISANVATIMSHDPKWAGVLAYDEFAETIVTTKPPPWRDLDMPQGGAKVGDWTDSDTTRVQCYLADAYTLDVGKDVTVEGMMVACERRRVHPVRDWLDSLRWDGQKRVPNWLVLVMGCDDSPYVRAVGQAWAISAIARAYKPGCKVDTVLVLEGPPGIFKSSVLRALVGDEWFLEMSVNDVSNKDAMQILKRKWIAEFPEIDGLSRTEQSHVKAYFSRQVDTYRASYGRGSRDYPRQTVFTATTNKGEWLADETGGTGRRMWPVRCRRGDVALARLIRDQFWAEARTRYESGELWHITDPELRDAERDAQDARFRVDPWESTIAQWLASPVKVGLPRATMGVTTADVMGIGGALGIEVGKHSNADATRVGSILRRLGWMPGDPETRNGARVRVYRPSASAPEEATSGVQALAWPDEPESGEDAFPPREGHGE